ncbi:MAG: hypothetical protein ACRC3Z_11080 [Phocaeicola sp.]
MTTKIQVSPHLLEYITAKYCDFCENSVVRFPDSLDIYHVVYDLLEKRPANSPIDVGNLEIHIPCRSHGKKTHTYNYLSIRAQAIIQRKIEGMMWAELHDHVDTLKHRHGVEYITGIHLFMQKYDITTLSEDAFVKNYYRWRAKIRRKEKRNYTRKVG